MLHTVAWSQNVDLGGVLTSINAVPDQSMKTVGTSIYVNQFNKLIGAMSFGGASNVQARLVSPSLRRFQPFEIIPLNLGLIPTANFQHSVDNYIVKSLDVDEQLEAQLNSNPAAAEQISVAAWLADQEIKEVYGDITPVRFQFTVTLVAGVWNFAAIDFIDDLAVGTYTCVGLDVIVPTGVIARLVPVGAYNRPGVPCMQTLAGQDPKKTFRNGHMGELCTFPHNNPPSIEILASADVASATYYGVMDLIKK